MLRLKEGVREKSDTPVSPPSMNSPWPQSSKGVGCGVTLRGLFLVTFVNSQILLGQTETRWTAHVGAGVSNPIGQTSGFVHASGTFAAGLGYRFSDSQSAFVEYYYTGLPFNDGVRDRLGFLHPSSDLYAVTVNYKHEFRGPGGMQPYLIGGGGWYHRVATITRPFGVGEVLCSSSLYWWTIACLEGTVPLDKVVAGSITDALGFNGGAGMSRRIRQTRTRWYVEIRYHYAPSEGVPTRTLPILFGLTW